MPLHIIDGIPKSMYHSDRQNQTSVNGTYFRYHGWERSYLQDPIWFRGLEQEYERRLVELEKD